MFSYTLRRVGCESANACSPSDNCNNWEIYQNCYQKCLCWSGSIKEAHHLNKNICHFDLKNFLIIFFFMYKKHELMTVLIFRNNIFRHIGTNLSKNTYSKKKRKWQNHQDQSVLLRRKQNIPNCSKQNIPTKKIFKAEWIRY